MESAEIKNVEILDAGTWQGSLTQTITESDLDQMVVNFKAGVISPWMTLNHDPSYSEKVRNFLKVASLGWVTDLKRVGTKLYADFNQVPLKIATLIKSGTIKKRSVEVYTRELPYPTSAGKIPNVLAAVSFFGADEPAVNTLSDDFEVLMLAHGRNDNHKGFVSLQTKSPENQMADTEPKDPGAKDEVKSEDKPKEGDKPTEGAPPAPKKKVSNYDKAKKAIGDAHSAISEHLAKSAGLIPETESDDPQEQAEMESFEKLKGLADSIQAVLAYLAQMHGEAQEAPEAPAGEPVANEEEMKQVEAMKAELKARDEQIAALTSEIATFKKSNEDKAAADLESEAKGFVETQIKAGRILPKAAEFAVKQYAMFKKEGPEALSMFKEDVANRPSITEQVNFSFKPEGEKVSDKPASAFKSTDELQEEIEKVAKATNVSFAKAREAVLARKEI